MCAQRIATSFDVWTFKPGDEEFWTYQTTTFDLGKALTEAKRIGRGSTVSAIYERGRFQAGGREVVRDVLFWWSENGHAEMEGAPRGRGWGWSDDYEREVTYDPLDSDHATLRQQVSLLPMPMPVPAPIAPPQPEYATVACAHCGRIVPMNQSRQYTFKHAVGSTSGTYRSSNSTTVRQGTRSSSTSYRHGSSSSSGRTYYKHDTVWLCRPCYRSQLRSDRLRFILKALAIVLGIYLWIHFVGK